MNTLLFAAACYVTWGLLWIAIDLTQHYLESRAELRVKNSWALAGGRP